MDGVIPAKAEIQEKTGFRVKPGMTNWQGFMLLYIAINSERAIAKKPL